ncbi:DUF4386 domain-containing protein [Chitinimonas sp. BJYL2]|uniref:DUF4386 domain-containing protein n=1 Tax=Chitinimonas sp. BJYL2 TaxID=2976696 RepID=UPI0022B41796|nr:DUF4386 domain-containing protein [Chitinimonas sp. BJYL2]
MHFETHLRRYLFAGGIAYLANILLGLFGEAFVRSTLIVAGDAMATASNIAQSPGLWRAGIAGDLVMQLLDIPLIVLFYLLLRPISQPLALCATILNIVQTAVLAANKLTLLAPLLLAADYLGPAAVSPQLHAALTQFAVNLHGHGFAIGLIFFGFTCLIRGYLIVRSGFLPATLGILLLAAGVSYLINSAALLFAPALAGMLFPWVLLPSLIGELALSLWLICRGIKLDVWQARLRAMQQPASLPA